MGSSDTALISTYPREIVQDTADSLAINVSEEAVKALAVDIEFRISEIVQEATKFMRHAKRTVLTVDDINHAIRVRSVEVRPCALSSSAHLTLAGLRVQRFRRNQL